MATRTDEDQLRIEEETDCLFCKRNAEAEARPRCSDTECIYIDIATISCNLFSIRKASASDEQTLLNIPLKKLKTGKEIGRGAYGRVFEVKYGNTNFAAKELHALLLEYAQHEGTLQNMKDKFLHECRIWSLLHHPRIVQFTGLFTALASYIATQLAN